MIQNQYKTTYISTSTTTTVAAAGNITVHTVNFPIAITGAVTFTDVAGSPATYFAFAIGAVGSFRLDTSCPNGLKIVTAAGDQVIVTTQTP